MVGWGGEGEREIDKRGGEKTFISNQILSVTLTPPPFPQSPEHGRDDAQSMFICCYIFPGKLRMQSVILFLSLPASGFSNLQNPIRTTLLSTLQICERKTCSPAAAPSMYCCIRPWDTRCTTLLAILMQLFYRDDGRILAHFMTH